MAESYRQFRMPLSAYEKLRSKQHRLEESLLNLTGKPIKIPMTKLMNVMASQTVYLKDDELVTFFMRRKR